MSSTVAATLLRARTSPVLFGAGLAASSATVVLVSLYWATPVVWLLAPTCAVAAVAVEVDLRVRRVPNALTAVGAISLGGLVLVVRIVTGTALASPAVAGVAICSTPLLLSHVMTRGRTPGLGDVKLAGVLGLTAGAVHPAAAYATLLASLLLGIGFGLLWRASGRGRAFPFAPALAMGLVIVLALWPLMQGPTTW